MKDGDTTQTITQTDRDHLEKMFEATNITVRSNQDLDIGGVLLKASLVTEEQLREALEDQNKLEGSERLGQILIRNKIITEYQLIEAISKQLRVPLVRAINDREIPEELIKKIPTRFAKRNSLIAVGYDDHRVHVVTSDPLNTAVLDDIRQLVEAPIKVSISPSAVIMEAINRSYDRASSADEAIEDFGDNITDDTALEEPVDLLDSDDEAPIIRLVNSILFRAVKERASDIHVEPFEREVAVRFRVDGDLYDILKIPKRLQGAVSSRIKLVGGLNIAEKRLPQDGRIRIKIAGNDVDLRLSTVPTAHGERIVLRLLDKSNVQLDLSKMGFEEKMLQQIYSLIEKPYGILLVTGPTGSGKTTTLYGGLNRINKEDINIMTVEDPIEYQLKGIGQIQVNDKIGLTFASGLRSILRQDPDVVLIGEIRDRETAEIAVQASLTGHLVLSSIHTNDATATIARLVDMGVEPFLVAGSLVGIIAQRLVRSLCPECREPTKATSEQLSALGVSQFPSGATVYKAKGCESCHFTGYRGRIGIFELLVMNEDLRSTILKTPDTVHIRKAALRHGYKPMRVDGLRKILRGETTIEEVLTTTQEDEAFETSFVVRK